MGLDMTVLAAPLPGHEAEFDTLLREIAISDGMMADPVPRPRRFFGLLPGARRTLPEAEHAEKRRRMDEISLPAYANLGAPRVGTDAAADQHICALFHAGDLAEDVATEAEALRAFAGHYVLELLPPCDGMPVYTHGGMGYDVDKTSFRGAFLASCTAVLTKAEINQAWEVLPARELGAYGKTLETRAWAFAQAQGLTRILGQRQAGGSAPDSAEAQLHIVDSLARWSLYWSARGHGSFPYF